MLSPKRAKYSSKEDNTINEAEHVKSLKAIEYLQEEMEDMQEEYDKEILKLEQKLEGEKKPIYVKRKEEISNIPNFWATALMNHPDMSSVIDDTDEEYLLYLTHIEVELLKEMVNPMEHSFKIVFHFIENPYFENDCLVREYISGSMGGKNLKKVKATTINWKEGQDMSEKLNDRKSFLAWLTSVEHDPTDVDIAQIIKEDLWTNPLQYYLLSDNENEEESEEEEDEDVLIIEDSDDDNEKSVQDEAEEESDNETDEYDSPASSDITQNEN